MQARLQLSYRSLLQSWLCSRWRHRQWSPLVMEYAECDPKLVAPLSGMCSNLGHASPQPSHSLLCIVTWQSPLVAQLLLEKHGASCQRYYFFVLLLEPLKAISCFVEYCHC